VLDWWEVDHILSDYHRQHGLVKQGLERARSRLNNYFANLDGRARRLSSASTVVEGDWEKYTIVSGLERVFQKRRAYWLDNQLDKEQRFRALSNLSEALLLNPSPPVTSEAGAAVRPITSEQGGKKKKRSKNRRTRAENQNSPLGYPDWTGTRPEAAL